MNKAGVSRTTWLRIIMPLNAIQTKQIIQVRKMLLSLSAPRTFGRQCCQLFCCANPPIECDIAAKRYQ